MFDTINQIIETNKYLIRELEHQKEVQQALRNQLAFLWDVGTSDECDIVKIEQVKDVLAEDCLTFMDYED